MSSRVIRMLRLPQVIDPTGPRQEEGRNAGVARRTHCAGSLGDRYAVDPKPTGQIPQGTLTVMDLETERPFVLGPARYVLLPLANIITGYSVKAMERKIERGDWVEGKVWRRAPDGRILVDLVGYQKWVENS
jgi:hypothetical protein